MPDDTNMFQRAGNSISKNPGKVSASVGGGLSIGLALLLFASKDRVEMLEKRLVDEHIERMNLETACEERERGCVKRFERLALRTGLSGTNHFADNP